MQSDVVFLRAGEEVVFLLSRHSVVLPDAMEAFGEIQFKSQVCRIPVARQTVQNYSIRCHYEYLNVVRTGTIGSVDRCFVRLVSTGVARVRLFDYVVVTADEAIS